MMDCSLAQLQIVCGLGEARSPLKTSEGSGEVGGEKVEKVVIVTAALVNLKNRPVKEGGNLSGSRVESEPMCRSEAIVSI